MENKKNNRIFFWIHVGILAALVLLLILQFIPSITLTYDLGLFYSDETVKESYSLFSLFSQEEIDLEILAFLNMATFIFPVKRLLEYIIKGEMDAWEKYKGYGGAIFGVVSAFAIFMLIRSSAKKIVETFELNLIGHLYWILLVAVFILFVILSIYALQKCKALINKAVENEKLQEENKQETVVQGENV